MKVSIKHKLRILMLLFTLVNFGFSWSQQEGFNYKAIIKDDLGNVISNQTITIQLTIFIGDTQFYQETHTPTTNANGLVILTIGAGTTSDSFESIDWSIQNHNLKTEVDIGNGLIDFGITPFQSVPYAAFAEKSTGLEQLDEGNGQGWRLFFSDKRRAATVS